MCVSCFGLVVSTYHTYQVIGYRKTPLMTLWWREEIISTKPRWIFLLFGLSMLLCVPSPGPTQYIFHMPMARYSLFVLKQTKTNNLMHYLWLKVLYICRVARISTRNLLIDHKSSTIILWPSSHTTMYLGKLKACVDTQVAVIAHATVFFYIISST